MNLKSFRPIQNPKRRDSGESHQMWIALGSILAVVLAMVIVLTLVSGADATLLDR